MIFAIYKKIKLTRSNSVGFKGQTARLMPNINCSVSAGTLVFSTSPEIPNEFVELLEILGSSVGTCLRVDESQFNAASAISGCGPAFVRIFYFVKKKLKFNESDCHSN